MLAILIQNLASGGAERLLVNTIPEYLKKGIPIKLFLVNEEGNKKEYIDSLSKLLDIEILGSKAYNPFLIFKLRKIIKRYSVLHVHLFPLNVWVALSAWIFGSKGFLIHTDHGLLNKEKSKGFWIRKFIAFIYNQYDYIIVINETIKTIVDGFNRKRQEVVFIPNGIDIAKIESSPVYSRKVLEIRFGIPTGSKLLLMCSRIHTGKRHDLVFEAIHSLGSDYHLLLLGVNELDENLTSLKKTLGIDNQVHLLGFDANPFQYMKMADLNILASDYEGMSGVVLESLASKTAFLGSNVSGINNLVPHGDFLFTTANELAKKVASLSNNESRRKEQAEEGYAYVQQYDIIHMLDAHVALYKKCIALRTNQTI